MPQFAPDQVTFKDLSGYGAWDIGHHREHLQFVQAFSAKTPAILLPNYDFQSFLTAGSARRSILETHAQAHHFILDRLGITGTNLEDVNLDDQGDFYSWLGYHATEHGQIRQVLGIT